MNDVAQTPPADTVLVVGGGMAGLTTAIEVAEAGRRAVLVEKLPYLGGRVARSNLYFPKLCPPYCGLEINFQRLRKNPRIQFYTQARVESLTGRRGQYEATIRLEPRYVTNACTACGACAAACQSERLNDFNMDMDRTKAAYLPHEMAFPMKYVIDASVCTEADWAAMIAACPYGAIQRDEQPRRIQVRAAAVVIATGWDPYPAQRLSLLGAGRLANVIRNVEMERLAAPNGPTGGRIVRPSDGQPPRHVAFVQCAGSRDENHLAFCSGVCCLASMKQAGYVRQQWPDSRVTIYYIDLRALGRLEDVYAKLQADSNVRFVKGKVARITEDPATKNLDLVAEDILSGRKVTATADLVVLATGMVPTTQADPVLPGHVTYDPYGFVVEGTDSSGIFAAGCAKEPVDVATTVRDATAAALKAIQCMAGGK